MNFDLCLDMDQLLTKSVNRKSVLKYLAIEKNLWPNASTGRLSQKSLEIGKTLYIKSCEKTIYWLLLLRFFQLQQGYNFFIYIIKKFYSYKEGCASNAQQVFKFGATSQHWRFAWVFKSAEIAERLATKRHTGSQKVIGALFLTHQTNVTHPKKLYRVGIL